MEVDLRSSSNDLSDPPSDYETTPGPAAPHPNSATIHLGVANSLEAQQAHLGLNSTLLGTTANARQDSQPVKKPRKKREPKDPNAPPAEKKPRITTRKPRGASTAAATGSRKRTKTEPLDAGSSIHIPGPHNSSLQSSTLVQPVSFAPHSLSETRGNEVAKPSESGFSIHDRPKSSYTSPPTSNNYAYPAHVQTSVPPQSSTRAMYDPIRGDMPRPSTNPPPPTASTMTPPRSSYNPSTSPAISGIIDHPAHPQFSNSPAIVTHLPRPQSPYTQTNGSNSDPPRMHGEFSATNVDVIDREQAQPKKASSRKIPSEASTRATSPKPARAKEQPPPPPMGSGLLSASLFGGESSNGIAQKDSEKGPNIVLHVDLKDPSNRVINFARMAEAKYGFAALYPRQAAQKERLARIAAAGAALERSASGSKMGGTSNDSGDEDLSVDIDRDSENDGDVAMTGVNGGQEAGNSGTDGAGTKRRRKKVEEYDVDDDFVDDSEMLWETQAAASKDGFFVYCGPLVPEGEKPAVERADGTIKRGRGRGRGGGPGSRGGRASAAAASEGGTRRGGGSGSRGGGTTRKPRITKDERAQMEKEKLERQNIAPHMTKPAGFPV